MFSTRKSQLLRLSLEAFRNLVPDHFLPPPSPPPPPLPPPEQTTLSAFVHAPSPGVCLLCGCGVGTAGSRAEALVSEACSPGAVVLRPWPPQQQASRSRAASPGHTAIRGRARARA